MTDAQDLRERLRPYVERARDFSGWSFAYQPSRLSPPLPWSYEARVRELIASASTVCDLGTGGGEVFAAVVAGHGGRALATEEWDVNAPVAAARLRPLGVSVLHCRSTDLPLPAASVDLLLSRHEAIDPFEVARVLAPGGTFLTQQVDNLEWAELREYFPRWTYHGDHWAYYQAGLIAAGMTVARAERDFGLVAYDFGELVYQLCLMPWDIADFDPLVHDLPALLRLQADLERDEGVILTECRYILEARKPG